MPLLLGRVCAAIARQAQEPGRRVSRANEWAELQARTNGRYGKIELDLIRTDERKRNAGNQALVIPTFSCYSVTLALIN